MLTFEDLFAGLILKIVFKDRPAFRA